MKKPERRPDLPPAGIAPEKAAQTRGTGAVCAALLLGTILLFARALGRDFEFVNYDDPDYLTANAQVQAGLSWAGAKWALTSGAASNWHPLTWMSHQLDWSLYGRNPRGHHATSILLHAVNAVLAFVVLRRLTGAFWTSAVFAALFAWHPLRVESVVWASERKDVLSGLFWFLTLWAYAIYAQRRARAEAGTALPYALALAACALGLMAKPMLVTLPCVLLLLDFWPLGRLGGKAARESAGRIVAEKLPFFGLSLASSVVTYLVQREGGAVSMVLSLEARLANAVVAVVRYLGKLAWPFDLAVLYPHPGDWPARKVAASVVILAGLTALAWAQRRRRPWLAVGWLWFLGTLVPVIGLVQVGLQSMADRYTYLPMLGVALALLWTARGWFSTPSGRRGAAAGAAVLLAALAARTWHQIGYWRNSYTLFDHAIAVTANNYLAHNNRGIHLGENGRTDEAAADYRRALAIRPDYPNANNNLGRLLVQQGRAAEAVPLLRAAVAAEPAQLAARNNLANALSDAGALPEAMEHYEFILARQPRHVDALTNSGVALAMQGKPEAARERIEAALRIEPDNLSATSNLGNVYAMLGQRDAAIRQYRRAIALAPGDARSHHNLGNVLSEAGQLAEAAENFARAVAANPANADSRAALGFTYGRLGRREEALRELRAVLAQRPDHAQARAWLQAVEQGK